MSTWTATPQTRKWIGRAVPLYPFIARKAQTCPLCGIGIQPGHMIRKLSKPLPSEIEGVPDANYAHAICIKKRKAREPDNPHVQDIPQ